MATMNFNAIEVAPRTGRQENAFYARLSRFTGNDIQTLEEEPVSLARLDSLIDEVKFTISSSDLERWTIIERMLKESTNQGIPNWGWPPGETATWFFDLYLFDFHHQAQRQYYDSISTTVLGGLKEDPIQKLTSVHNLSYFRLYHLLEGAGYIPGGDLGRIAKEICVRLDIQGTDKLSPPVQKLIKVIKERIDPVARHMMSKTLSDLSAEVRITNEGASGSKALTRQQHERVEDASTFDTKKPKASAVVSHPAVVEATANADSGVPSHSLGQRRMTRGRKRTRSDDSESHSQQQTKKSRKMKVDCEDDTHILQPPPQSVAEEEPSTAAPRANKRHIRDKSEIMTPQPAKKHKTSLQTQTEAYNNVKQDLMAPQHPRKGKARISKARGSNAKRGKISHARSAPNTSGQLTSGATANNFAHETHKDATLGLTSIETDLASDGARNALPTEEPETPPSCETRTAQSDTHSFSSLIDDDPQPGISKRRLTKTLPKKLNAIRKKRGKLVRQWRADLYDIRDDIAIDKEANKSINETTSTANGPTVSGHVDDPAAMAEHAGSPSMR